MRNIEQELRFEAEVRKRFPSYSLCKEAESGDYVSIKTQELWGFWQAACVQSDGGEAVGEIAEINGCPVVYWDKSLPIGTKFYTHPPAANQGVPEGYALVPESMCLSYEDVESIITMTGWDEGRDDFGEGVLWVGTLKDDDGQETYGLHISCIEVMEEGALPVQEFRKPELINLSTPPQQQEGN